MNQRSQFLLLDGDRLDAIERPSTIEGVLVVAGILVSPFWFVHFFGVNLTPTDVAFVLAATSYVVRTRRSPPLPSKLFIAGAVLFIASAGVSTVFSPLPVQSALNLSQYLLIFFVVVPMTIVVLQDETARAVCIYALWAILTIVTVIGWIDTWGTNPPYYGRRLTYSNHNQLFWLVGVNYLLSSAIALDHLRNAVASRPSSYVVPCIAASSGALSLYLIAPGQTVTAILLVLAGSWLLGWHLVHVLERERVPLPELYLVGSFVGLVAGIVGVYANRERLINASRSSSIDERVRGYEQAIEVGIQHFPFGVGLDASSEVITPVNGITSIHNFVLSYFVEIGIFGVAGILVIIGSWTVQAAAPVLDDEEYEFVRIVPSIIFLSYLSVLLLQPVPVRRFWWILFAVGWLHYGGHYYSLSIPRIDTVSHWISDRSVDR